MSKDLYVRNLSQQTTEEDLRTLFSVAGKVTYIHLVIDAKTEQFLGCAYVKMSSEAEARDAINALNEARYQNAYISVSVALPRTPPGTPRLAPEKKRAARTPAASGAQKKQDRSIVKGDWTGPAPAKKKDRSAPSPRTREGAAGGKRLSVRSPATTGTEKTWPKKEKPAASRDGSTPAPVRKERSSSPSWRKEGEEGRKGPSDWTSRSTPGEKPRVKALEENDWTAPTPAKKERSQVPPWRKSSGPKKGPGPKRDK